jgi:hypothetical protein
MATEQQYEDILVEVRRTPAGAKRDALIEKLHAVYLDLKSGTTTSGLPYPSPTDPVAQGADAIRSLAEAVDSHMYGMVIAGGLATGNTDVNGIIQINVPAVIQNCGRGIKFVVVSWYNTGNDAITTVATPVVWDSPPYAPGKTSIQLRIRREDTHAWFGGNPATVMWFMGA